MRTFCTLFAAGLFGLAATIHAQVSVSPGFTPWSAQFLLSADQAAAWSLLGTPGAVTNYLPNVEAFGASGSDTNDDTAALQSCLNASGGRAYFPKGSYRLTNTLSVGSYPYLVGEGVGQTYLTAYADNIDMIHVAKTNSVAGGLIADLTVYGANKASNGIILGGPTTYYNASVTLRNVKSYDCKGCPLKLNCAMWTRLEDCEFRSGSYGLGSFTNTAGATLQSTTLTAERCHFVANTNAGLYAEMAWGFRFRDCIFEGNQGPGSLCYSPSTTTINMRDMQFENCWYEGNNDTPAYTNLGQMVFIGSTNKPIREVTIRNCHFESAGALVSHIYLGVGNYTLEDPVFSAGSLQNVVLEDSPYVIVRGSASINPANSYTGLQTGPYEWFRTNMATYANAWFWSYGSTNYAGRGAPLQPATLWVNGGSGKLVPVIRVTGSTNGSAPTTTIFGTLTNITY